MPYGFSRSLRWQTSHQMCRVVSPNAFYRRADDVAVVVNMRNDHYGVSIGV